MAKRCQLKCCAEKGQRHPCSAYGCPRVGHEVPMIATVVRRARMLPTNWTVLQGRVGYACNAHRDEWVGRLISETFGDEFMRWYVEEGYLQFSESRRAINEQQHQEALKRAAAGRKAAAARQRRKVNEAAANLMAIVQELG